jgi:hypothetical protein
MQTKFKRHQKVKILISPNPEYIEYHNENPLNDEATKPLPIIRGMIGIVNVLLPNGQYHVEILDKFGKTLAYAPFSEEALEEILE